MTTSTKLKRTMAGIELVRSLAYEGDRIFTTDRARELAPRVGLSNDYVLESLHHLHRNDWIVPCGVDSMPCPRRFPALRPCTSLRWPWHWFSPRLFPTGQP